VNIGPPERLTADYVLLAVRDTGCGMDAETQSRIFEPFFTTKELGRGTGLGLATVYGIVQQGGGQIDVKSQPGNGTTFSVYLPAVPDCGSRIADCGLGTTAPDQAGLSLSDNAQSAIPNPQSETVLLVEDEPMVRRMVREVLRVEGYTVLEAIQGDDALRVCQQEGPVIDLLLTDVMMPGMSGRELVERAAVLRPGMKVLFMSGYTDDAVVRHGVSDAEIAFIQKPFKPAELTQKVREVLGTG
jgi:CheY-like chemotaxis protein